MALATRCPDCGTSFRIVPDQLKVSDGWVRCGFCGYIFDAYQTRYEVQEEDLAQPDISKAFPQPPDPPPVATPPSPAFNTQVAPAADTSPASLSQAANNSASQPESVSGERTSETEMELTLAPKHQIKETSTSPMHADGDVSIHIDIPDELQLVPNTLFDTQSITEPVVHDTFAPQQDIGTKTVNPEISSTPTDISEDDGHSEPPEPEAVRLNVKPLDEGLKPLSQSDNAKSIAPLHGTSDTTRDTPSSLSPGLSTPKEGVPFANSLLAEFHIGWKDSDSTVPSSALGTSVFPRRLFPKSEEKAVTDETEAVELPTDDKLELGEPESGTSSPHLAEPAPTDFSQTQALNYINIVVKPDSSAPQTTEDNFSNSLASENAFENTFSASMSMVDDEATFRDFSEPPTPENVEQRKQKLFPPIKTKRGVESLAMTDQHTESELLAEPQSPSPADADMDLMATRPKPSIDNNAPPVEHIPLPDTGMGDPSGFAPSTSWASSLLMPSFEDDSVIAEDSPSISQPSTQDSSHSSDSFVFTPSTGTSGTNRRKRRHPHKRPEPVTRAVPLFIETAHQPSKFWQRRPVRIGLAIFFIVLLCGLAVQTALTYRDALVAKMPELRPILTAMCKPLGCEISYPRALQTISIDNSEFQIINASTHHYALIMTLRNRGNQPVATPWVELTLPDASGQIITRKTLSPAELGLTQAYLSPRQEAFIHSDLIINTSGIRDYSAVLFYP